jgi:transposase-like protein
MYEADHAVRIIRLGNRLQHEMARSYDPDRDTIAALCQEIENSAHEIYKWVRGIEGENNG